MGVFSRLRDIVNSNLNVMLERAEDPEKLIKLMILEMEDTLVEIKASAAGVMATRKKARRELDRSQAKAAEWGDRARLALDKQREDLAREALREKRFYLKQADMQESEVAELDGLIEQYGDDIRQLEDKLAEAREKHRVLVKRHVHAREKKRVQKQIRKVDSTDAVMRFDQLEHRVDRMEAEADLVNLGRRASLEDELLALQEDEEIESELAALKARVAGKNQGG